MKHRNSKCRKFYTKDAMTHLFTVLMDLPLLMAIDITYYILLVLRLVLSTHIYRCLAKPKTEYATSYLVILILTFRHTICYNQFCYIYQRIALSVYNVVTCMHIYSCTVIL